MHANEMIEILKDAIAGKPVTVDIATDDEVKADIRHRYEPTTRFVTVDVRFIAQGKTEIGNYGVTLSYRTVDGLRSVRGWGETEGPEFAGGVDMIVIDRGNFSAQCTVGTWVKTDNGYKLWMRTEDFEIKA